MALGHLFQRIGKSFSKAKKKNATSAEPRKRGGKILPALPAFLKKDKYLPAEPLFSQTLAPEMADSSSFKRPGAWLRNKIGGSSFTTQEGDIGEASDNINKIRITSPSQPMLNDHEIQNFLNILLEESKEE